MASFEAALAALHDSHRSQVASMQSQIDSLSDELSAQRRRTSSDLEPLEAPASKFVKLLASGVVLLRAESDCEHRDYHVHRAALESLSYFVARSSFGSSEDAQLMRLKLPAGATLEDFELLLYWLYHGKPSGVVELGQTLRLHGLLQMLMAEERLLHAAADLVAEWVCTAEDAEKVRLTTEENGAEELLQVCERLNKAFSVDNTVMKGLLLAGLTGGEHHRQAAECVLRRREGLGAAKSDVELLLSVVDQHNIAARFVQPRDSMLHPECRCGIKITDVERGRPSECFAWLWALVKVRMGPDNFAGIMTFVTKLASRPINARIAGISRSGDRVDVSCGHFIDVPLSEFICEGCTPLKAALQDTLLYGNQLLASGLLTIKQFVSMLNVGRPEVLDAKSKLYFVNCFALDDRFLANLLLAMPARNAQQVRNFLIAESTWKLDAIGPLTTAAMARV